MFVTPRALSLPILVAAATLFVPSAAAQTVTKAATGTELSTAANWTGGVLPGSTSIAEWASTSLGTGLTLASSLTWQGVNVTGALTNIVLSASTVTPVLSIGSSGITLAGASNLSLTSSLAFTANQNWSIAGGRSLNLIAASRNATGSGNIILAQTGTGTANILWNQNGNNASWAGYSGNITVGANVKVQSQGNAAAAFGTGKVILDGGAIHQRDGSWTFGNNLDVTASSTIGQDSNSGLGRQFKLLGNLSSLNNSTLTFNSTTTGGTRTDSVGFILAGENASTYGATILAANSRLRVGGNAEATIAGTGSDGGTRGSLGTGDVTLVASTSQLAFTRTDAYQVSNAITGLGTVVIGGNTANLSGLASQVVTLSGVSNYTGATRVSRSRLNLTGSLTSAITVDTAGTISGTGSTTGLLSLASGSNLVLAGGANTGSLTVNGATFVGTNAVVFSSTPLANTLYDVFTYGSGTVTTIANLLVAWRGTLSNDTANQKYTFLAGSSGTRSWATTTGTWQQDGDANFAEGDQKFFGGDAVVFGNIATDSTVTLTGSLFPESVTVSNAANTYTLTGSAVGGASGLTKSGNGNLVLSTANTYLGGTTISAGTLRAGNTAALGSGAVTVVGGTLDVAGLAITNSISISGSGNGVTPALWNSALTAVSIGLPFSLSGDASVGSAAATSTSTIFAFNNPTLNGHKLTITAGAVGLEIRRITTGSIEIANGGTLYSQNGGTLTSATGTITVKSGGRMETRDTDNTAMTTVHNIVLDGGTLSTAVISGSNGGGAGTTLKNDISVSSNGGTLTGNNTSFGINLRLNGALSGTGDLTINGARGVELRGDAANYTGTATVTDGTLTFNYSSTQSFGGILAGSRPIVKSSAGTLVFLADNTMSGTLTISGGAVQVGNAGTTGSLGTAAITNSASLIFNRSNSLTVANVVSGAGTLNQLGSGSVILTAANVYSGATTVSNGTLSIANGGGIYRGAFRSTTLSIASGATLDLQNWHYNESTASLGGLTANTTGMVVNGGTIRVSGNSSYGRGVTVNSGGVTLEAAAGANWTIDTVNDSNAWIYNGNPSVTFSGTGTGTFQKILGLGTGAVTKTGESTWTLSGANTYSGGTTIAGGKLIIGQLSSLGSGTVLVSGGILDLNNLAPTNIITLSGGSLLNASAWASTGVIELSGNVSADVLNALPGEVRITAGTTVNLTGVTKDIVFEGGTLSNLSGYQGNLKVKGSLDLSAGAPAGEIEVATGGTVAFGNAASSRSLKFTGGTVTGANYTGDIEIIGSNIALGSGIQAGRVRLTAGNSATIASGFERDITFAGGTLAGLTIYSGTVSLETGATLTVDDTTGASFSLASGSTLKGDGTIDTLTQAAGSILAPGNSPGLLTTATFAPAGGAIMEVEFYDPSGFAGTGYDAVSTSTLDLSSLDPANRYILKLISLSGLPSTEGPLNGFDASQTYAFDVFTYATLILPASYAGGIADLFTIDLTRFQDGAGVFVTQGFTLSNTGSALVLNYAPIPEPSTYGLILGGLALAGAAIRRRKKV